MNEPPMTATEIQQRLDEQDKKIVEQQQKLNLLINDALLPVFNILKQLLETK